MTAGIDIAASSTLLLAATLAGLWFVARSLFLGDVHSERVARAGTTIFLGRNAMEAAYATFEPVGRLLARLGISANAVTMTGVALTLLAGVMAAFGWLGVAALLAALGAAADALDGIVARATTGPTRNGALYDSAADRYMEFFLFGGLVIHFRTSLVALLVVLGALCGAFMVSYVSSKSESLAVEVPRGAMRRAERAVYLLLGLTLSPLAASLGGNLPWAYDAPVLLACVLIALVANVSAFSRLLALGHAIAAPAARSLSSLSTLVPTVEAKRPAKPTIARSA